jgi:aspartate kinase
MRSVVMKFGGSSVVDAAAIDRVIGIVEGERAKGHTPVVVVSALGGVTDTLLTLARAARGGNAAEVQDGVAALLGRHHEQAAILGVGSDDALAVALGEHLRQLQAVLDRIQQQRESDGAALDEVAATGELLSSQLIAAAMASRGLPAVWVDARHAVCTDDRYTCAAPTIDAE